MASPLRLLAATTSAILGLTALVAAVNPFRHQLMPACPFHAATGLWCPFCGGTRAMWAAAHGDWGLMFHANALLPAISACVSWAWLAWAGRVTGRWRLPLPRGRAVFVAAAALLMAFAVLRNLPGFSVLAPPAAA
jgi:hypothetical protein